MGDIINFPPNRGKRSNKKDASRYDYEVKLFGHLKDELGVDLDKVLFEDDDQESEKLARLMQKRTLQMWTQQMNDDLED